MSEWISMSNESDDGGFKLELRLEQDREHSEIRLLYSGAEVARGQAVSCAMMKVIHGIEPGSNRHRPFDLHDEEIMWLAERLGIVVELKAEVDEEDYDEEEL